MKIYCIVLIPLIVFLSCNNSFSTNYGERVIKSKLEQTELLNGKQRFFVGYINNYPVFDFPNINKLYLYKDSFEYITNYPQNYTVLAVSDSILSFYYKNTLIIKKRNIESKFKLKTKLSYIVSDDSSIFYTDNNTTEIFIIKRGFIRKTKLKGWVIGLDNNYLYFTKESNPNLMFANVDVYRISSDLLNKEENISTNLSGENTVVFNDGKFIYDFRNDKGEFKPVIYNVSEKKFINIGQIYGYEQKPYYSFQKGCLAFYKTDSLCIKYVHINLL